MAYQKGAKTIFITGGGSGIGRAVAEHFAAKGWFVGLGDIDRSGMNQTTASLPDGQSSTYEMDVRDIDDWNRALKQFTGRTGGRLDVLFNNAGIGTGGALHLMEQETIDRLLEINLRGVVNGARAAFAYLKNTPDSCLLNTGSAAGIFGRPGMSIYCASKFGVRGFTESLEVEWQYFGIKVAELMPSFIDTPMLDDVSAGSNLTTRETVQESGLEFTPLPEVAQQAWDAVHGTKIHIPVGQSAKKAAFFARWFPGLLRKKAVQAFGESSLMKNVID